MSNKTFSNQLNMWRRDKNPKTLNGLIEVFGEKSFAVAFILLLLIPALPIPTGGVTHIFEIVAMLLAIEMMLNIKTVWLPKRWKNISLESLAKSRAVTKLIKQVEFMEKYSRPRLKKLMEGQFFTRTVGALFFIFTLSAFIAPPFSGLDTLPSLAVVLIALALILEDMLLLLLGILLGMVGIGLTLTLGSILIRTFRSWF